MVVRLNKMNGTAQMALSKIEFLLCGAFIFVMGFVLAALAMAPQTMIFGWAFPVAFHVKWGNAASAFPSAGNKQFVKPCKSAQDALVSSS